MFKGTAYLKYVIAILCFLPSSVGFAQYNEISNIERREADVPDAAKQCIGCHGVDGLGVGNLAPQLAGMSELYIQTQLTRFERGERLNPYMAAIINSVDGYQLKIASQYFSSLTPPDTPLQSRGTQADFSDTAANIVYKGDWSRDIPSCVSCHGAGAKGVGPFPRLAGQDATYLATQLNAWQTGERTGEVDNMMANIAQKLTAAEIRWISAYLAKSK